MGGFVDNTQRHPPLRAELQAALNLIPAFAWYCNASGGLTFLNERGSDYLGLPKDHPLRHGIDTGAEWDSHIALLHPDDHEEARRVWSTLLRTGCAGDVGFRVRNAEGGYRWHLSRAEPVRASDGTLLYWIGVNLDIEDRKQTELYLAEGQRFAHKGSWTFNAAGFDWSPELFRIYGLEPSGKAPTVEEYMALVHPEDREFVAETIQKMFAEHRGFDFTKRIVRPDGEIRRIRCVGSPATHAGTVQEFIGTGIDVTEHELLTQELGRREAYLAEAQRLSHTGSFGWKPETGELIWSAETYRIFEYDRAVTPTIDLVAQRVHPEDRADFQSVIEHGVGGAADFEHAYRLLLPDGRVKHVHALAHATRDAFGNREFVGAVTDITEQRRAEESLRESESYLAEAQKLSHTGSWAWSPDTDVRYWSEECYRVLGFDPRDGLPRMEEFIQRIHPDDQPAFKESAKRATHTKFDEEVDYRIVHPGGAVRDIHSIGHPIFSPSGDLIEFTGTVIDITERKRAEEELRASERKYRHLVDTTPAFVHTALPSGDIDFFNCGWLEYVGVSMTDMLGWRWAAVIHPEDVDAIVSKWRASLESGERFVHESRVRRADGEYRWFMHRKEPLRNEHGEIVKWYGSSIEIEERKIAEEKLRRSEAYLLDAQQLSHTGSWNHDLSSGRVTISPETFRIWGVPPEEDASVTEFFFGRMHPDDRPMVEEAYEKARLRKTEFASDFRILLPDGTIKFIHSIGHPILNESSEILEFVGAAIDVTEQRRARAELERAFEEIKRLKDRLQDENIALREEIIKTSMFEEIVGNSPALQQVLVRMSKVAPTDSTVLITGETGTGKELIARAIHKASKRADRAFVSVNCAAIPPSLIPSELFGHEKGAFTGATGRRLGRFELAEGGTIFLDEVGELPAETQVALLRVLQEREFERVGGNRSIKANVRVIVATNRDLPAAIAAGTFREDLFYRLNVFPIEIPPLRERSEDIPILVQYFIDRYARKEGKNVAMASKETLKLFQAYPWPGNIRELQNVIERSIIVSEGESFSVDESWLSRQPMPKSNQFELRERLNAQEREAIEAALTESRGRVFGPTGAAAKLGIARSTLESKIKTLKIDKNRFKLSNPSQEN